MSNSLNWLGCVNFAENPQRLCVRRFDVTAQSRSLFSGPSGAIQKGIALAEGAVAE